MKKNISIVLLFLLFGQLTKAQLSISGIVKDMSTGEILIGAYIIDSTNNEVTSTNQYGYFNKLAHGDSIKLTVKYIGYNSFNTSINRDTLLNIELQTNTLIDEVTISDSYDRLQSSLTGVESLTPKTVNALPTIMGESDIIKTFTLMPGVSFGAESASGYYVRGGSADQNLLLIDGVPVYNPYHLYGYFSVFNTDAINKATLYKGAMPAEYGGRLSSVLDISMKNGNAKRLAASFTLGTLTSKATLEVPILKDKTTLLISARRSMLDLFNNQTSSIISLFSGITTVADQMDVSNYYFFDWNSKASHRINDENRVYFNIYQSKDTYANNNSEYGIIDNMDWQNRTSSVRWNHIYSSGLFSNATLYYSNYRYNSTEGYAASENNEYYEFSLTNRSEITDYAANMDFYQITNKHKNKFGVHYIHQRVNPAITGINTTEDIINNSDSIQNSSTNSNNIVVYFSNEYSPLKNLTFSTGLHLSNFISSNIFYPTLQPRLSINYLLTDNMSIKTSYSRMVQHLHLLTNNSLGRPSDTWISSSEKIKPQKSDQFALGITLGYNLFTITAEAYLKYMHDLVEFAEGTSFFNTENPWMDLLETGQGKAKGLELSVRKNAGKFTGLISYTLSKSTRQFENINNGNEYPFIYDRTHDISAALTYAFNSKFLMGANWVYATGHPVTIADQHAIGYFDREQEYNIHSEINNARLPNYHRLDVCLNYIKKYDRFSYAISTGVYNAYNRRNPHHIYAHDNTLHINSMLGILPYITLKVGFN